VLSVRSGHNANVRFVKKLHAALTGESGFDGLLDQVHFDINAICRIMPHRYPLLLVDRILHLEERKRVIGLKNVTINEPFFVGHFPGHPIMPAVLIVEAMAQCGGILLLNTVEDPESKLVYFMGIDNAKFRRPVLPGDQLIMDLELVRLKTRICKMNARGYVRGQLVAEAELSSTIVDR
jgi:UDP-3-O-[3-hydroxymyristoyl] N-acetylglucosamine deacetylase/3-hydroxyacyl-[acyl-carrier-protein] dehydratase